MLNSLDKKLFEEKGERINKSKMFPNNERKKEIYYLASH